MLTSFSEPPKKILLGLQEGLCNLACPKCHTHSKENKNSQLRPTQMMSLEDLKKICEQVAPFKPRMAPQTWDEPLLDQQFLEKVELIKSFDLVITMDTNGLLLNKRIMTRLIELKVDSIFISVDAYFPETYEKTRGSHQFNKLLNNIHEFLRLRGEALLPRIGVSFVEEECNKHETELFVDYWKEYADVIRVNRLFHKDLTLHEKPKALRSPCWSLWDSLLIHPNGDAALCCVDNFRQVPLGNVLDDGVLNVWNNRAFQHIRSLHLHDRASEVSICSICDLWSNDEAIVTETATQLISSTHTHTYYNNKHRLHSLPGTNRYLRNNDHVST